MADQPQRLGGQRGGDEGGRGLGEAAALEDQLDDRRMALSALKTAIAAVVMGLVVWGFLSFVADAGVIIRALGGTIVGMGVFFVAAWLLRSEELHTLLGMVRRRLRPMKKQTAETPRHGENPF